MTKSHALEDKYNAEQDAKKIAEHEQAKPQETRMLNDDEVLGTINNPEDILHAM